MGGKAPSPPKPSSADIKQQKLTTELLEKQLADAKKPAAIPDFKIPPPLTLPPPVSASSGDAFQAAQEAKRKALGRTNSGRGTLFAGETGGYRPAAKTTLLG